MKPSYHQHIFDATPDGVLVIDDQGAIMDANRRVTELFGYTHQELLGRSADGLISQEAHAAPSEKRQNFFNRPVEQRSHALFNGRRKDGTTFPIDVNIMPIETEDGALAAAIIRDITQHEAEKEEYSRLAAIVESATDAIIGKRLDGTIQSWNPAAEHLFGYTPQEIIGRHISVLIPKDLRDEEDRIMARIKRGERVEPYESVRQHKNGRLIDVWLTVSPVRDIQGHVVGASKIVADLTTRKRTEKLFRNLLESAPDAMVVVDTRGKVVLINSQTEKMFGYAANELLEQPVELLIPDRFHPNHANHRDSYFHNPRVRPMGSGLALFGKRKDGSEFPIEISLGPIETDEGMLVASAIRDITARKNIEQQLDYERNYATAVIDALPGVFYHYDAHGKLVRWNKNYQIMSGYTNEELARSILFDNIAPEDRDHLGIRVQEALEKGAASAEATWMAKDGARTPYLFFSARFNDKEIIGVGVDISELKHTERSLQDARDFADATLNVLPGIFYHYDAAMRLVRWNKNHETITGYSAEELLHMHPLNFFKEEDHAAVTQAIADGIEKGMASIQANFVLKDGRTVPYLFSGVRFGAEDKPGVLGVGIDISDIKKAERIIRNSLQEKEILLKEIHHRVKNNLAVISSLFYLESKHLTDATVIKVMQESQDRIRSMALVHESLYSTDIGTVEFSEYANALARQLVDSYSAGGRIKLTTHLEPAQLGIDIAVPCGLILNEIVTNAVKHAFPDDKAGMIHLNLHWEIGIDGRDQYVIEVRDDGVGFPSDLTQNSRYRKAPSLGLRLIHALTRQVDGIYEFVPGDPGTIARLTLRLERENKSL